MAKKNKMAALKKEDAKLDKKKGLKEGSAKDERSDKAQAKNAGVPYKKGMM